MSFHCRCLIFLWRYFQILISVWPHSNVILTSMWWQVEVILIANWCHLTSLSYTLQGDIRMMPLFQTQNYVKCICHFDVDVWYFIDTFFKLFCQFDLILTSFWYQCDGKSKSFWWQNDVTVDKIVSKKYLTTTSKWRLHTTFWLWNNDIILMSLCNV